MRTPVSAYDRVAPVGVFAFDNFYNVTGQALYLQDRIDLTPRWNLIGAVRHSWVDVSDGTFGGAVANQADTSTTIWQIGSAYQLTYGLSVYAGYDTGFDIESTGGSRTRTGEPLAPEESNQKEIGVRYRDYALRGSLSLFDIRRANAATSDPVDPDFLVNAGEQRVRGIEIEGEWAATPWWSVSAGYAYRDGVVARSNDGIEGGRIADLSEHAVTVRTDIAIPGTPISVRGGLYHAGSRALVDGGAVTLPAYTLADVGIGVDLAPLRI